MPAASALPFPRIAVEAGAVIADALISIGPSPGATGHIAVPSIPVGIYPEGVLRLAFDDVPCATWTDERGATWRGPMEADLSEALAFARDVFTRRPDAFVAVHCEQGRSRSAAIALAIVADRLGPGTEADAVRLLMSGDDEGQRCFNPLLVRFADRMLGRNGALEDALTQRCRPFVTWRRYWIGKDALPLWGLPEGM